ncbi:MAG TPA: TadE/TadG family type IV pilus assembly protein [Acidimicrobiales bacterium]|jgi:hypothetical protein|nr:TadE/TadG family type IV pilus assembly protein [Acidimicrobiales bacterium]
MRAHRFVSARRRTCGSGLLGTVSGVGVFLLLLFFAVQLCVGLYARSAVTAAAYDAARSVAGYRGAESRVEARRAAEEDFRRALGRFGTDNARLEWLEPDDPDVVRVRVVADLPTLLPAAMVDAIGFGRTDRTLEVRVERFR